MILALVYDKLFLTLTLTVIWILNLIMAVALILPKIANLENHNRDVARGRRNHSFNPPDETGIPSGGPITIYAERRVCLVRTNNRISEKEVKSPFFTANFVLPFATDREA